MKKYNVAILGATGAVGAEFLKLINFGRNRCGGRRIFKTDRRKKLSV